MSTRSILQSFDTWRADGTPLVLLAAGVLFLIVALSYAEATSALPETGGAATFVRRSMNDLAGFVTGWALILDYLIVIALAALFVPHYMGGALRVDSLERHPGDIVVAVGVIVLVAVVLVLIGLVRSVLRPRRR